VEASRYSNYYDNVTTLHPLAIGMLVVAIILIFVLPRRHVFLPIILLTCLVPAAQRVVILGADFHFLRIVTVFAWARLMIRGEQRKLELNAMDKTVVAWIVAVAVATVLRSGSFGAVVNQAGRMFDCLGIYFLGRMLIRDWRDLDALVVSFIWTSLPIAAFSIYEVSTVTNPFYIFGQAEYEAITRDGRVRARGAFSHQILAGSYWVAVLPLIVARFWQQKGRILTGAGLLACLVVVVNCASSTPLLGMGVTIIGAGFYLVRQKMRWVRWGIVVMLIVMQMMMGKPIWHLLHRVGAIGLGSSTGYHRYRIIEAFVDHFGDWALIGEKNTGSWGRQLEDLTNHFVTQGVQGGLLGFLLFIGVISFGYMYAGRIVAAAEGNPARSAYAWGLGVAVLGNTAMMLATSYFGQILFPLYITLAAISSLAMMPVRKRVVDDRPRRKKKRKPDLPSGRAADLLGHRGRPGEQHPARSSALRVPR
jgi:hypothetical protein